MAKGSQFTRYIPPSFILCARWGGSATAAEVTDAVIERERFPEELLEKTSKNGHDVTPFIGPGLMRVGGRGHAAAPCCMRVNPPATRSASP
jgi:hypothetical protein